MLPSKQNRRAHPKAAPFPIIPFLAAGLVMLGGLQLFLSWQSGWPNGVKIWATTPAAQPFDAVVTLQKKHQIAKKAATRQPPRLALPESMPLLTLGNPNGEILLTVFADPSRAAHRTAIQKWLRTASRSSRLEIRFAPTQNDMSSGILFAFARSQGLEAKLWQALQASGRDASPTEMMEMLAKLGISLNDMRDVLSKPNPAPLQSLQPDLAWAAAHSDLLNEDLPLVLIEGYAMQAPLMRPDLLGVYIERRLKGEDLVQAVDFL